jgi:hypothetical protein
MGMAGDSSFVPSRPKRLEAQSRTRQGADRYLVDKEPQVRENMRAFNDPDPMEPARPCQGSTGGFEGRIGAVPRLTWVLATLLAIPVARAGGPSIDGEYDSPLGRIRVSGDGARYRGTLVEPSPACPFAKGDEVLRGTLLDDALAGEVRAWLGGDACSEKEEWASAVLLVTRERLAGAAHVAAKGCKGPFGKRGGLALVRARKPARKAAKAPPPEPRRDGARALVREGAARLAEGAFEAAERRFLEAIRIDPALAEAYNGVGVTWRMRNDLGEALAWYKKALAADPDFGDAYYNMACVYALRGEKDLALRWLRIAAQNGYATAEGIGQDPDLEALREDPGYRALVRARL